MPQSESHCKQASHAVIFSCMLHLQARNQVDNLVVATGLAQQAFSRDALPTHGPLPYRAAEKQKELPGRKLDKD